MIMAVSIMVLDCHIMSVDHSQQREHQRSICGSITVHASLDRRLFSTWVTATGAAHAVCIKAVRGGVYDGSSVTHMETFRRCWCLPVHVGALRFIVDGWLVRNYRYIPGHPSGDRFHGLLGETDWLAARDYRMGITACFVSRTDTIHIAPRRGSYTGDYRRPPPPRRTNPYNQVGPGSGSMICIAFFRMELIPGDVTAVGNTIGQHCCLLSTNIRSWNGIE